MAAPNARLAAIARQLTAPAASGRPENPVAADKERAAPYDKPGGQRAGFDSIDMDTVMVTQQQPAVRVKLEMAGKPQAAQFSDGAVVVAGFIEPPVHAESRCTLQFSTDMACSFGEPIVLPFPGRTAGFRIINDTMFLLHGDSPAAASISRSQVPTTTPPPLPIPRLTPPCRAGPRPHVAHLDAGCGHRAGRGPAELRRVPRPDRAPERRACGAHGADPRRPLLRVGRVVAAVA